MATPAPLTSAEPTVERAESAGTGILARLGRAAGELPSAERLAIAAVVVGVALRILAAFTMDLRADGNTYTAMAYAWAKSGTFTMPWGDVTTWAPSAPAPSHHYPPLYPVYLGLFYKAFGFHLAVSKAASIVASLVVLPVVWWTSRDLYGREKAWLATGLVAAEPHLVWVAGSGFSENLVLAFFALTMWAILKSLEKPAFILVAGLAAGLTYLTRASIGYFFLVAGLGGFLWRFYYMRWRVLTNGWYLGAIVVFGAIVGAWAARNVAHFGWSERAILGVAVAVPNWQTSSYTEYVSAYAAAHPDLWWKALAWKVPLFAAFLAWYVAPFAPEARASLRRIREEHESALWLSVILVALISWIFCAMFWTYEQTSLAWLDNHRYVVIAFLPLSWLLFRRADTRRAGFRARYAVLAVTLLLVAGYLHVKPAQYADIRAGEALVPLLAPGDEVAVSRGMIKYSFYAYLDRPDDVTFYGWDEASGARPHFIVSVDRFASYPGYVRIGAYSTYYPVESLVAGKEVTMPASTWARADVARDRGLG